MMSPSNFTTYTRRLVLSFVRIGFFHLLLFSFLDSVHEYLGWKIEYNFVDSVVIVLASFWWGPIYRSHELVGNQLTIHYSLLYGLLKREQVIEMSSLVEVSHAGERSRGNAVNLVYRPYNSKDFHNNQSAQRDEFEEEFEVDFLFSEKRNSFLYDLRKQEDAIVPSRFVERSQITTSQKNSS